MLRGLVIGDFAQAIVNLSSPEDLDGQVWTPERLQKAVEGFYAEHERICLDPEARNARHTYVVPSEDKKTWRVQQMLVDPEGHNDWVAEFEVDLVRSRAEGRRCMVAEGWGTLGKSGLENFNNKETKGTKRERIKSGVSTIQERHRKADATQ